MIEFSIPGRGDSRLAYFLLDLNGTLTLIATPSILTALDLLLNTKRLVATMCR